MIALNFGWSAAMNRIQTKTNLFRSFSPDARYLIGVSGGRDSVALLRWLVDLGYRKLIVCHFDHHLRGRSSQADARFVKKLAAKYRVDFQIGSANVRALAKKKRMSIETAAREARYSFFAKVAKRRRCRTIFLAHHADDLVETFLLNLFRGAGTAGLAAMRQVSTRRIDKFDLVVVRPFLGVWRKEIDIYLREQRLKFREDASNKNLNPLRNRVRHRVIPYLEKMLGRNIRQNIWRTAVIAAEEENWIENQLPDSSEVELPVAKLRDTPVALQRRRILKWLRAQSVADVGFDLIERVRSLAERDARIAKVNLPQDRHARRRAGKIFIE
ncbi:MAG: tRNA lysidine(34) synthetase TilS [Verrucomicrobia bacterium]|nr:MAG: tRNA lysidine(34) synthetase TilS [Verrucomicrobiota bacterium]